MTLHSLSREYEKLVVQAQPTAIMKSYFTASIFVDHG